MLDRNSGRTHDGLVQTSQHLQNGTKLSIARKLIFGEFEKLSGSGTFRSYSTTRIIS